MQEERQAEDSGQRQEGHQQAAASRDDLQRNWGFMACTFAAFYSGLPGVISRAAIYAALVILTHTSLRQTPSEHAIKLRNLAQNGGTHCPGVPFLEVIAQDYCSHRTVYYNVALPKTMMSIGLPGSACHLLMDSL